MVNGDERFAEIAAELVGKKSPSEVREEELVRVIKKHFGDLEFDTLSPEDFTESEAGLIVRRKILE